MFRSAQGVWLGLVAFAVALIGTELLPRHSVRGWAVLLLAGAGILAVLAWYDTTVAAFSFGSAVARIEMEIISNNAERWCCW